MVSGLVEQLMEKIKIGVSFIFLMWIIGAGLILALIVFQFVINQDIIDNCEEEGYEVNICYSFDKPLTKFDLYLERNVSIIKEI